MGSPNGLIDPARLPIFMQPLALFPGYPLLHVVDEKASPAQGGGAVSGNQIRTLNTVLTNEIAGASLAADTITLPAGTYYAEGWAIAFAIDVHKASLIRVAVGVLLPGSNEIAVAASSGGNASRFSGRFVLAATATLQVQHYTQQTAAVNGLGVGNAGTGVPGRYVDVRIWKLK